MTILIKIIIITAIWLLGTLAMFDYIGPIKQKKRARNSAKFTRSKVYTTNKIIPLITYNIKPKKYKPIKYVGRGTK